MNVPNKLESITSPVWWLGLRPEPTQVKVLSSYQKTLYKELVLFSISLSNSLFNVIWSFYSGKWRCVSDCTTEWMHEIKLSTNIASILFRTPNKVMHSSLFGPIRKLQREKFYDHCLQVFLVAERNKYFYHFGTNDSYNGNITMTYTKTMVNLFWGLFDPQMPGKKVNETTRCPMI
jgi:hypothetical protein